jgi:hypothetical protein
MEDYLCASMPLGVPHDFKVSLRSKEGEVKRVKTVDSPRIVDSGWGMNDQDDVADGSVIPGDATVERKTTLKAKKSTASPKKRASPKKQKIPDDVPNMDDDKDQRKPEMVPKPRIGKIVLDSQGEPRVRVGISDDEPSPPRYVSFASLSLSFLSSHSPCRENPHVQSSLQWKRKMCRLPRPNLTI